MGGMQQCGGSMAPIPGVIGRHIQDGKIDIRRREVIRGVTMLRTVPQTAKSWTVAHGYIGHVSIWLQLPVHKTEGADQLGCAACPSTDNSSGRGHDSTGAREKEEKEEDDGAIRPEGHHGENDSECVAVVLCPPPPPCLSP